MLVVTYHAFGAPASRVVTPMHWLEDDLSALIDAGFSFVSLDACAQWLAGRLVLPARTAVVTFDDGYASVVTDALPVLMQLQVPSAVFVVAGRLGLDNRWPGQPAWVPRLPLLDGGMLRDLAEAGVTIGSHSWSHPRLPMLDDATLHDELVAAADRLEQAVDAPVRHLAYPYGRCGTREIAKARSRFTTAVTAVCRPVQQHSDPHALGRIDAHDLHVAARLDVLSSMALRPYLAARRGLRAVLR